MRSTNVKTGYILAVASAAFATLCIMLSVLRMFEGVVFSLPAVGANALSGASDGIFMLGTQETSGTAPKIRHVVAVDPGHGGSLAFAKLIVSKWHGLSATVRGETGVFLQLLL
jgi:hypothetical protein